MGFQIGSCSETETDQLSKWILDIKSGDQQAAAELVRHFEPEVRRFIRVRLTDTRMRRLLDSVDVCQSVMVRFFHRLQTGQITVEHPLQLLKLLITMARNSLLDHVRKAKLRRTVNGSEGDEILDGVSDGRASHEDIIDNVDLLSLLRSRLKDQEQQLLDRWLLGNGWDEISMEFNAEPDALRKRMTRAIDRASKELGFLEDSDVDA